MEQKPVPSHMLTGDLLVTQALLIEKDQRDLGLGGNSNYWGPVCINLYEFKTSQFFATIGPDGEDATMVVGVDESEVTIRIPFFVFLEVYTRWYASAIRDSMLFSKN